MKAFLDILQHCELCPRRCGIDRFAGERGFCQAGDRAVVAHYGPHFGEEPPISGTRGSGTVFFSPCNLRCVFCQNYQISHETAGSAVSVDELATIFFTLADRGAHNINLVSPTPYVPVIAAAIEQAKGKGIEIPFLYNTNAYENVFTIALMKGLVDIYLPDMKYWSNTIASKLSSAPNYRDCATAAIEEMKTQVGDLVIDEEGIATRGLLMRHLVLPGGLAGTKKVVQWIADALGVQTAVSLMSQYSPIFKARKVALINRRLRKDEYDDIVDFMRAKGFQNVFLQEMESADLFLPDFENEEPFHDMEAKKMRR